MCTGIRNPISVFNGIYSLMIHALLTAQDNSHSTWICIIKQALTSFFQGSLLLCNSWSQRACSLNKKVHPAFPLEPLLASVWIIHTHSENSHAELLCKLFLSCELLHRLPPTFDQVELLGETEFGQLLPKCGHLEVALHFIGFY